MDKCCRIVIRTSIPVDYLSNCTVIIATKPHFPIHLASENPAWTRNGSIDGTYLAFGIADDEPVPLVHVLILRPSEVWQAGTAIDDGGQMAR